MHRTPVVRANFEPLASGPSNRLIPHSSSSSSSTAPRGRITAQIPLEERFYPAKHLLELYPNLRYERWLPGMPHRVKKDKAGHVADPALLRGPNGNPLCLWCGEETKFMCDVYCSAPRNHERWAVANAGCEHEHRLRKSGVYVREQLFLRDQGKCDQCGIDTFELFQEAAACPTLGKRSEMFSRLAGTISPEWISKVRRPLLSLDVPFGQGMFWEAAHVIDVSIGGGLCGLDGFRTLCVPCHTAETGMRSRLLQRSTPNHCHTCGAYSPARQGTHVGRPSTSAWSAPKLGLSLTKIQGTPSHQSIESQESMESLESMELPESPSELLGIKPKKQESHQPIAEQKLKDIRKPISTCTYDGSRTGLLLSRQSTVSSTSPSPRTADKAADWVDRLRYETPTKRPTALHTNRSGRASLPSIHSNILWQSQSRSNDVIDLTGISPTTPTFTAAAAAAAAEATRKEQGSTDADLGMDLLTNKLTAVSISPSCESSANSSYKAETERGHASMQRSQPIRMFTLAPQLGTKNDTSSSEPRHFTQTKDKQQVRARSEPRVIHRAVLTHSHTVGVPRHNTKPPELKAGAPTAARRRSTSTNIWRAIWTSRETLAVINGFRRFGHRYSEIRQTYQADLSARSVAQICNRIRTLQENGIL